MKYEKMPQTLDFTGIFGDVNNVENVDILNMITAKTSKIRRFEFKKLSTEITLLSADNLVDNVNKSDSEEAFAYFYYISRPHGYQQIGL